MSRSPLIHVIAVALLLVLAACSSSASQSSNQPKKPGPAVKEQDATVATTDAPSDDAEDQTKSTEAADHKPRDETTTTEVMEESPDPEIVYSYRSTLILYDTTATQVPAAVDCATLIDLADPASLAVGAAGYVDNYTSMFLKQRASFQKSNDCGPTGECICPDRAVPKPHVSTTDTETGSDGITRNLCVIEWTCTL